MADNKALPATTGKAAGDEVTYSGDADAIVQLIREVGVTGSEGSKTVVELTGVDARQKQGAIAHDSPISTLKPVGIGARASSTAPSNVSNDDDLAWLWLLLNGAMAVYATNPVVMCSTDVTRPGDTAIYAIDDAISNSTSAPTSGGFTFTGAARISGGAGIITDLLIMSSNDPATKLQGEVWIFDRGVTNINDNAAFAVTDAEIKTVVAKIPFTLEDSGNNQFCHVPNLNIGFVCNGSADLRFLIRAKNAYTPANAEVLTFVLKVMQVN